MPKLEVYFNQELLCTTDIKGDNMKTVSIALKSFLENGKLRYEDRLIVLGNSLDPDSQDNKVVKWVNITPKVNDEITIKVLK